MKLPAGSFKAEYAKSGRAACKKCKQDIKQGSVRLAKMVQSSFFDGCQAMWHHVDCALQTQAAQSLASADDIHAFSELRWSDQEKIRAKFDKLVTASTDAKMSGRAEGLQVQYAKSGKSMCKGCEQYIEKNLVRLSFLLDSGGMYGPAPAWHHVDCFFTHHAEKAQDLEDFSGWSNLTADDQAALRERMDNNKSQIVASQTQEDTPAQSSAPDAEKSSESTAGRKRRRSTAGNAPANIKALLRAQNERLWMFKDALINLTSTMTIKGRNEFLEQLLSHNKISVDSREYEMLDVAADCMCYGVAEMCSECQKSRLVWQSSSHNYSCPTHQTWGKCPATRDAASITLTSMSMPEGVTDPSIAKLLKEKPAQRVLPNSTSGPRAQASIITADELEEKLQKTRAESGVKLEGDSKKPPKEEERRKVTIKGRAEVDAESELESTHHVLEIKHQVFSVMLSASDVDTNRNSYYRMQVLEGDWISRDSQHNSAKKGKKSGVGSAAYYFFRRWGRVGTKIGGNTLERCESMDDATERFRDAYRDKTMNEFDADADAFVKHPRMYYPLDIAVPDSAMLDKKSSVAPGTRTKLPKSVQTLLQMIFDVEAMRRVMLEMDIDLVKMPLGNISRTQLKKGYNVLNQAQLLITDDSNGSNRSKLFEVTNQFFTLIPHNFGRKRPPLLDNSEIIRAKLDMLEALMEMEIATTLLNNEAAMETADMDPLDVHYNSMRVDILPIARGSEIFATIERSVKTTHAATHNEYTLEVVQVFEISRHQEREAFCATLATQSELIDHRRMLWHGSRITNFAGILSQGLRIAPPEAPVSGYMFGKGVYFADLVSKSANYCFATRTDSSGLLLLSEVALGVPQELTGSKYIEKLPRGKHSVKGCGKTVPSTTAPLPSVYKQAKSSSDTVKPVVEPVAQPGRVTRSRAKKTAQPVNESVAAEDQLEQSFVDLSLGPTKQVLRENSELLYNEFIVYDPTQICMRYLVQVSFVYK